MRLALAAPEFRADVETVPEKREALIALEVVLGELSAEGRGWLASR